MKEHFKKRPEQKVLGDTGLTGKDISTAMVTGNAFLNASTSRDARTENMALSNSSTGNIFVDDFGVSGAYRGRETNDVYATMSTLWNKDPLLSIKLAMYLRLITRKVNGPHETEEVQKGQGNRDESLRRLLWIAENHPDTFHKNLWLLPAIGSWKDMWTLMGIDTRGAIDNTKVFEVMRMGLDHENTKDLVLKYLPQIRAKSKCNTDRAARLNELAKEFATHFKLTHKDYRKMKASGNAHVFQQQISMGLFDDINFDLIPGKALLQMTDSKFLANHKLEAKYEEWIDSKPVAKFNGYPYELLARIADGDTMKHNVPLYLQKTVNKQFDMLVQRAKEDRGGIQGNVWCALDTSGSMTMESAGKSTAFDVCVSLGIYFSALNEGAFKDNVIMFNDNSKKLQLGGTFTDKANQILSQSTAWGSTNFQSVIDEIVRIRVQNPNVPIEDFPQTLLVVSDMQFNPSSSRYSASHFGLSEEQTNYQAAMAKLNQVGLPAINVIWWQVNGRAEDVPSRLEDKGTAVISGFDGAMISMILGGEAKVAGENTQIDMLQVFTDAMGQPLLTQARL